MSESLKRMNILKWKPREQGLLKLLVSTTVSTEHIYLSSSKECVKVSCTVSVCYFDYC